MRHNDSMTYFKQHPLDVEIADLVDGLLDPKIHNAVEVHLAQCLLCRIKRQRFVGQPCVELMSPNDVEIPKFNLIETQDEQDTVVQAGDLWITKGSDGIVVLVRSVDANDAIVVPVVVDVELADDECQIVPAKLSPLGVSISVYGRLRVNIPVSALCRKIVFSCSTDLLNLSDIEEVFVGLPIEGPDDPRLEVRQWLTDHLTSLSSHQSESRYPIDSASLAELHRLREALNGLRPSAHIESLVDLRIPDASEREWTGIARVEELGVVVLVIDTPLGLTDQSDFLAAHTLLTRCNASALAVAASGTSDLCDVFDAPGLFGALQVLNGDREHKSQISDMPLSDAITKYLDNKLRVPYGTGTADRGTHVKVERILSHKITAAVDSTVAIGNRAKIEAKKAGYRSVGESVEALKDVLSDALSDGLYPDEIASIAGEIEQ